MKKPKFQTGDWVFVNECLPEGRAFENAFAQLCGRVVEVDTTSKNVRYRVLLRDSYNGEWFNEDRLVAKSELEFLGIREDWFPSDAELDSVLANSNSNFSQEMGYGIFSQPATEYYKPKKKSNANSDDDEEEVIDAVFERLKKLEQCLNKAQQNNERMFELITVTYRMIENNVMPSIKCLDSSMTDDRTQIMALSEKYDDLSEKMEKVYRHVFELKQFFGAKFDDYQNSSQLNARDLEFLSNHLETKCHTVIVSELDSLKQQLSAPAKSDADSSIGNMTECQDEFLEKLNKNLRKQKNAISELSQQLPLLVKETEKLKERQTKQDDALTQLKVLITQHHNLMKVAFESLQKDMLKKKSKAENQDDKKMSDTSEFEAWLNNVCSN